MSLKDAPLGQSSEYPQRYAPEVLFPVHRAENRARLGLNDGQWPWHGEDIWQAWELSWLWPNRLPAVGWGRILVPADSPCIVESKSMKLYFNSLNQTVFESGEALVRCVEKDLSEAAGAPVTLILHSVDDAEPVRGRPDGFVCLEKEVGNSEKALVETPLQASGTEVSERLCSHLLKSNCPVTGQPDWATLWLTYSGPQIDHASLLSYLVSFRNKQDFHEHCTETIFTDIMAACRPRSLTVMAQYTRRGGLDINPWRSTEPQRPVFTRLTRQ